MMTDITLPIWLLAVSAGVPTISFISLLLFILRKIRKPNNDMFVQIPSEPKEEVQSINHQFRNDLLALQIDTVFNGLTAIIETERIKMNTLLSHHIPMGLDAMPQRHDPMPNQVGRPVDTPAKAPVSLDAQIAEFASTGGQPEEIADEMGLSQAEVELALQMRSSRQSMQHRKLEAVA